MPICLGPDLPIRMVFALRYVAVAISVVLHAISGVCLVRNVIFLFQMSSQPRPFSPSSQSILALILQHFFPFLKQLPPSYYFDHTFDSADISHHHFPRRRDSGHSTHSTTSDSASDESSELRLSVSTPDPRGCLDDHFAVLLASQARARAARHPMFTLSSSLWTLKEFPSPYLPQVGEEHGSTTIPPDGLCDSPSIASSELSTRPQEEMFSEKSRKSSTTSKHSRSGHGRPFRLLPFHRRGSRSLSPSPPGQSRHTSPPLAEVDNPPRGAPSSSRNDQDHSRSSVLDYVWRVAPRHRNEKEKKRKADPEGQLSASRVGRGRTDPYQAPYFFPSPMSPEAYDYVRLAQHNRKPVLSDHAYTPMSTEGQPHAKGQ
ncbi:hypothetical protein BJY52DRAFT_1188132 [Lactarius psammicola]|nr:hypothetical protein BJY52DRAFT_1188132 [Lactarius psammicola]